MTRQAVGPIGFHIRCRFICLQKSAGGIEMGQVSCVKSMDSAPLLYMSGEEVRVGDRVQYCAIFATVVVVSDGETSESSPGYEDYSGADRGVIVCDDDGTLTTLGEPDERLIFVERG
jgi:hypothetical protein